MTTYCYYHPANEAHDPGPQHSERSERLTEIVRSLRSASLPNVLWPDVKSGSVDVIKRVHQSDYVDYVFRSIPEEGYQPIEVNDVVSDDDGGEVTVLSPQSGEALVMSIGQITSAVDAVMVQEAKNAFCLTRPPGHHALADKAMGFCVFNNAVIAAKYAQDRYPIKRVAIVDFDVHHGNGTQALVQHDPSIFFVSIHQLPLWPETGHSDELGCGNILNVPVSPNLTRDEWFTMWQSKVLRRLETEEFDFMIISAGFDAHKDDPKGGQNLESTDFYDITSSLLKVARQKCGGKTIAVLEGGYDINASATSAVETVKALAEYL